MKAWAFVVVCVMMYLQGTAQSDSLTSDSSILSDSSRPDLLGEVVVRTKKPPVQVMHDKIVVNVDASITNAGATVMEVLEKSPGITIDRNGGISLKGRQGVLVMIDGKPANISGTNLNSYLSAMSAAQVDQIEIMDNPPSRYDAAGNAGIINIKTKKNRQKGFNGNISSSFVQGRYPKTFNNLGVNYSSGRWNLFANLTANLSRSFSNLDAFRSYYASDNKTVTSMLEQPSHFQGKLFSETVKAGADYKISSKTSVGMVLTQNAFRRRSSGNNRAIWMNPQGERDSLITTGSRNRDNLNNYAVNLNARHSFNANQELTADFDYLGYGIRNHQFNNNKLDGADGYNEEITGYVPSDLKIFTAKADYVQTLDNGFKSEFGWKSSHINTNNKAEYFFREGNITVPDFGKTNHFIYRENIHAAYASVQKKWQRWSLQAGIRYENTSYNANQLGNAMRKDSSFSRRYESLFPTFTAGFEADSNNSFTFTAGRRIDRPPFHALNPFTFIINKYTYQAGNPYYLPQFTWNMELSHSFKNMIVTGLSYSITDNYFSQIFLQDSTGIITYTEGNLDRMENFGASISVQTPVTRWWSINAFTALNYKKIKGFVWDGRRTARLQANFNVSSQFIIGKGWSGELTWVQQLHEQELQEITDPTGQVGVGIARQILKNKGTLKLAFRDIFYTQAMKGFTVFEQSTEYFEIKRDSRVVSLAFTYRFGTSNKNVRRSSGGAEEEMQRVGS